MNETEITNKIRDYLKTVEGCFFFKEHGGMYGAAGIPDLILCYRGRFVALEVKTATGKVTVLQAITIKKIKAAGGTAAVIRSVSDVRQVLAGL